MTAPYEVYVDGRMHYGGYALIDPAADLAVRLSNRAPGSPVEIRGADGVAYKRFKAGQELIVEDAPEVEPPETPADVLVDAIYSDPDALSADDINHLFARLETAIYSLPKAPVLRLVRGGKGGDDAK